MGNKHSEPIASQEPSLSINESVAAARAALQYDVEYENNINKKAVHSKYEDVSDREDRFETASTDSGDVAHGCFLLGASFFELKLPWGTSNSAPHTASDDAMGQEGSELKKRKAKKRNKKREYRPVEADRYGGNSILGN